MRPRDYLGGLLKLHVVSDGEQRMALWRQSLATLAADIADDRRAVPLEGYDPEPMLASVQVALATGLVDDLAFLSRPAAAASLYELANALPASEVKRELGRRVFQLLQRGDAATFVAVATRLALGSAKALDGPAMRARVALSLELPIGAGVRADHLALALISRDELRRQWLDIPSTGSLPSRRLAARLLERAAREAAQHASEGDDSGVRIFETDEVRAAWDRLIADRESLVWRHVAVARGLLGAVRPRFSEEIERHLDPALGITEWRRAAASAAARIAFDGDAGLKRCRAILGSELMQRDRGLASAMIAALPRAAEARPDAAQALLEQLVHVGNADTAGAVVELLRAGRLGAYGEGFATAAKEEARAKIARALEDTQSGDDGREARYRVWLAELSAETDRDSLPYRLDDALLRFLRDGPAVAAMQASGILERAGLLLDQLESISLEDEVGRRTAFAALRELDLGFLETDVAANLVTLTARSEQAAARTTLGDIFQRLTQWLVLNEGNPILEAARPAHFSLRLDQLRTLLHLVDADGARVDERQELRRQRRLVVAQALFGRLREDRAQGMRRALGAACARAGDALVREEILEVSDVLLVVGRDVSAIGDLHTLAEASMTPTLEEAFAAHARLGDAVVSGTGAFAGEMGETASRNVHAVLEGVKRFAHDLPVACSPRVEALRAAALDLSRALELLAASGSLRELVELGGETPLARLQEALGAFASLVHGAHRRFGRPSVDLGELRTALRRLDVAVDRAARYGETDEVEGSRSSRPVRRASFRPRSLRPSSAMEAAKPLERVSMTAADDEPSGLIEDILPTLARVMVAIDAVLPRVISRAVSFLLARLPELPVDGPRGARPSFRPSFGFDAPLPAWMPPSRVIGGFYVVRAIGSGAAGSVFVARRAQNRDDDQAEQFAMKVPDYSGAAARTLSEDEFLHYFRHEAGALITLPEDANLAGFVTFDAGARPKPILVMELVEGPSLERLLELEELDIDRAIRILDGVAAGLEAMHGIGVAHLDLKPGNVILREPEPESDEDALVPIVDATAEEAVLVDFGLAGRHLRPGCGTANYGAPEIWGHGPGANASPLDTDVYAFGCLAYEVLTGQVLFDLPNDLATITAHISHDGGSEQVKQLAATPGLEGLGNLLYNCLRQDPRQRFSIGDARVALAQLAPALYRHQWPLRSA